MKTPQILETHMLYQLDKMMLEHLEWYLREEAGDPFRIYCAVCKAQESRLLKEAISRWKRMAKNPPQDDIQVADLMKLSFAVALAVNQEKSLAWSILQKKIEEDLSDLCALYSAIVSERGALERTATAIEWADTHCSKEYAARVKAALNITRQIVPWWWSANWNYIGKYLNLSPLQK